MESLYVVVQSMDAGRGGHDVKIHGCFYDKIKALTCMKTKATELQEKCDGDIEEGDEFFNVIDGDIYYVFEIKQAEILQFP